MTQMYSLCIGESGERGASARRAVEGAYNSKIVDEKRVDFAAIIMINEMMHWELALRALLADEEEARERHQRAGGGARPGEPRARRRREAGQEVPAGPAALKLECRLPPRDALRCD